MFQLIGVILFMGGMHLDVLTQMTYTEITIHSVLSSISKMSDKIGSQSDTLMLLKRVKQLLINKTYTR